MVLSNKHAYITFEQYRNNDKTKRVLDYHWWDCYYFSMALDPSAIG